MNSRLRAIRPLFSYAAILSGLLALLPGCVFLQPRVLITTDAIPTSSPRSEERIYSQVVYGQPDLDTNLRNRFSTYNPSDLLVVGDRLFVVDRGNNRVLIWNQIPTSYQRAPDVVIGQANHFGTLPNAPYAQDAIVGASGFATTPNATGLYQPQGICSDGTKLVVADSENNRVLIWNTFPTTSAKPADVVLGQPNFETDDENYGGTISEYTLKTPTFLSCDSGRLYVADSGNHRVLFWNSIPTVSQTGASGVLGQASFASGSSNQPSRNLSSMNSPRGITVTASQLFVADGGNNRILIWNTPTPNSLQAANRVLGQLSVTTGTKNQGGLSGRSLASPRGVAVIGTALYVSDAGNYRILVWDSIPSAATTNADRAIGQPNLTTSTPNYSGINEVSVHTPSKVVTYGAQLIYADHQNNRLMFFNTAPSSSATPADYQWGQVRIDLATANGGNDPETSLNHPFFISHDGAAFWVSDIRHNRILRWPQNRTPFDGDAPDLVIGQDDLTTTSSEITDSQVSGVSAVASDGTNLYVVDGGRNRLLIWNTYPTSSGAPADSVIGQADFLSGGTTTASASTLKSPNHVSISGGKLVVSDSGNNRVLIWNALPTASNTPANVVLGQPDASSSAQNNGGISGGGFWAPSASKIIDGKLFVCDRNNNRILVWNSVPTTSSTSADYAIGQPDLFNNGVNGSQATVSAYGFNSALDFAYNGKKFFVSDLNNSRILVWNRLPTTSGVPADSVIGQISSSAYSPNYTGTSKYTLWRPLGLHLDGTDLIVVDYFNHRLVRYTDVDI